jgi:hypothetical protein
MRNAILAVGLAFFAVFGASVSDASILRVKGGKLPVGEVFPIVSTETKPLDLTSAVSSASAYEPILVTNNSPASFSAWPYGDLAPGSSAVYRKRYLTDLVSLKTNSAVPGTSGLLTLSGSFGLVSYNVAVSSQERLNFKWGSHTGLRGGGFPLYLLDGSGTRTAWSITGVTDNVGANRTADNLFEIYNQRVVIRCVGTTGVGAQCPPDGQDTVIQRAGASAALVSPTGTWSVQLTNSVSGAIRAITLDMVSHQLDVAPTPSWVADTAANSAICGAIGSSGLHFGDTVVLEGYRSHVQTYGGTSVTNWRCAHGSVSRTQYSGGPAAPTEAYGYGNGSNDAGWITFKPREHLGAVLRYLEVNHRFLVNETTWHPAYIRWSGFDFTQGSPRSLTVGDASNKVSYVQWDHNYGASITQGTTGDSTRDMFVMNNLLFDAGGDSIAINGCDVQVVDNWVFGAGSDLIHLGTFQCTPGGSRSKVAFNFGTLATTVRTSEHTDGYQNVFTGNNTGLNLTADNWISDTIGNIFVEIPHLVDCADVYVTGVPGTFTGPGCSGTQISGAWANPSDIGVNYLSGAQGILSTIPSIGNFYGRQRFVGNLVTTPYVIGIQSGALSPGSVYRYNTVLGNTIPLGAGVYKTTGLGAARMSNSSAGAQPVVEGNLGQSPFASETYYGLTAPSPNTGIGNILNIGGAHSTYFVDPTNVGALNLLTPDAWLANLAPTVTAKIGEQTVGAVGNGLVDWYARTVDPAVLNSTVGANPPRCTVVPTVSATSGTGKADGDVLTATNTASFTHSPSVNTRWVREATTGSTTTVTVRATDTLTYTLSGDVGAGTTVNLIFIAEGVNADGTGACIASGFQIKP